jgi:hypothetical protein
MVAMKSATTVKRDGTVLRGQVPESTYYCDEHVP